MKKQSLIKKLSLTTAFSLLAFSQVDELVVTESFASQSSSAFYRSNKTRQAYLNLSPSQRQELDRMNKDGKSPLTIAEVLESGNYGLPIVKGKDWLYPFMLDRNKDGQVGENHFETNGKSTSTTTKKTETIIPAEKEEIEESEEELEAEEKSIEEIVPESKEAKIEKLRQAVERSKKEIAAAEYILENYPKTVAHVKDQLVDLIAHSKEPIRKAEPALANN